jgi:hypothetical protein
MHVLSGAEDDWFADVRAIYKTSYCGRFESVSMESSLTSGRKTAPISKERNRLGTQSARLATPWNEMYNSLE